MADWALNGDWSTNGDWEGVAAGPPTPTNVAAVGGTGQITITWDDVVGETGYRVERSVDGISGWTDISGVLPADTVVYIDTPLPAETTRFYRVVAIDGGGESAPSLVVSATTLAAQTGRPVQFQTGCPSLPGNLLVLANNCST